MYSELSAQASVSPSRMARQPARVSARATLRPGWPVNASVTLNGWVRKRCRRRARSTMRRSSVPSSSTPSSEITSCNSR